MHFANKVCSILIGCIIYSNLLAANETINTSSSSQVQQYDIPPGAYKTESGTIYTTGTKKPYLVDGATNCANNPCSSTYPVILDLSPKHRRKR